MEKDSRLEIRIAQQQLEELDAIRVTVNPPYTLSRSDVARMLIAKGIEDMKNDGERSPVELSLADRLMLYFQLHPQAVQDGRSSAAASQNGQRPSISFGDLLRHVYLKKYFWFFELDSKNVESLNFAFKYATTSAVLNSKPNTETNRKFSDVVDIVSMFLDIEACLDIAEDQNYPEFELVKRLGDRLGIPLKFDGFDINFQQVNQMADLFVWAKNPRRLRRSAGISTVGLSWEYFERMLAVYRDALQGRSELSMTSLQTMTNDRRLG